MSCGRWRKVTILIAVNTVPSRSSQRYICGFLQFFAAVEPRFEPHIDVKVVLLFGPRPPVHKRGTAANRTVAVNQNYLSANVTKSDRLPEMT